MDFDKIKQNAVDLTDIPQIQWKQYIGRGYRNSSYVVDSNRHGYAVLYGYDTNNNPTTFIFPHQSYVKYRVKFQTNEKDMFGNFVATKYFNNTLERRKWIEQADGIFIVEAFRPEQEILFRLFVNNVFDSDFNNQPLRMFYLDIETEISDTFENPKDARNRINMITIYDTATSKFYTWSLENRATIQFNESSLKDMDTSRFELWSFNNNEIELLEHFIKWWKNNYPDIVIAWNGKAYDYPYIVRRIENVLTKKDVEKLSPIGKYKIKEVNHDNKRAIVGADIEVDISGIFLADELVLYRDKFAVRPALDGGYSLDNVGENEDLGHKIKYSGTLKDLYEKDYQKFYEYNVRDVDLMKRIEEKCKLIPLTRRIVGIGLCNYDTIYGSIAYLIGSLSSFARIKVGNIIFQSYKNGSTEKKSYEGAFVFPPKIGRYNRGIATIDYSSLYPSTIRALNLSPETYIGKIFPIGDTTDLDAPLDLETTSIEKFYLKPSNGEKSKEMTKSELLNLCHEKCIFTQNNTLFLKHAVKKGIIAEWCGYFYAARKQTQKEMKKLELKLYNKEASDKDEIWQLESTIENLDNIQHSIKIMLNSIYGILGTSFSPIGNVDLAQTITRNGKFCNISAANYINDWLSKKFHKPEMIENKDVFGSNLGGDTDSQFVNINLITDYFIKKFSLPFKLMEWPDDYKIKLWKFMEKFVNEKINPFVHDLLKRKCFSENGEVLKYSLEYIADAGIYEQKKRYCVHKIITEGPILVDKLAYKGIELKRSNIPSNLKVFLKDIYENSILKDWSSADYRKYIDEAYDKFCKMSINDISFWSGWNSDKIEESGFLKFGKGTTWISKACRTYNQMLEKLHVGKKYESIKVGDTVRLCYVNPSNVFGVSTIAFLDGFGQRNLMHISPSIILLCLTRRFCQD